MEIIKALVLGIIQGFTEPLPISSSGHIFLFKNLFNTTMFDDNLTFEIISNFGSFLAILIIFRKDIDNLLRGFFTFIFNKTRRLEVKKIFDYCLKIIISTIPVALTGFFFEDFVSAKLENLTILAFAFMLTSLMLYIVRNIKGEKDSYDLTYKDAIIIGLFQAVTIIPGISRSGTVLVACLLCNLKRESALKYTFLLYFPVSVGTMILGISDMGSMSSEMLLSSGLGLITAFLITFISYKWLSNIVKHGKLWGFSIYCLLLAAFIFLYF